MALARGRVPLDSYYENLRSGGSSSQALEDSSSLGFFGLMGHNKVAGEGGKHFESLVNYPAGHLPGISDPSSSSSGSGGGGGFVFGTTNSPSSAVDSHHSVLNFKTSTAGCNYGTNTFLSSSMLSFGQGHHLMEDYGSFADAFESNGKLSQLNLKYGVDSRLASDRNCLETSSANGSALGTRKVDGRAGDEQFGWLYSEAEMGDGLQERELLEGALRIRPHMGRDVQPSKRYCSNKKAKNETISTKDPQSIAAKNRRERISERLKILQDLVPNGTKVDLVTMLEKAISYVKFLQLQVKVLATDEFWPSQGGKAPEIAQVKEAIDAILSSPRNPSSK